MTKQDADVDPSKIDTFGGYKWECIAISLKDYQDLCLSLTRSKDPNEKNLRQRIEDEVIPIIQQAQERQRRKIERRERELMMMERMVGAKRSGRLADKQDRERREAEQADADRKRQAELLAAHREQDRQEKMEQERQYRMMTRERRIREREYKRVLKEEELEKDAAEQRRIDQGEIRGSGRHLQDRIERAKRELEALSAQEEWTFDCSGCGKYGRNYVSFALSFHPTHMLTRSRMMVLTVLLATNAMFGSIASAWESRNLLQKKTISTLFATIASERRRMPKDQRFLSNSRSGLPPRRSSLAPCWTLLRHHHLEEDSSLWNSKANRSMAKLPIKAMPMASNSNHRLRLAIGRARLPIRRLLHLLFRRNTGLYRFSSTINKNLHVQTLQIDMPSRAPISMGIPGNLQVCLPFNLNYLWLNLQYAMEVLRLCLRRLRRLSNLANYLQLT